MYAVCSLTMLECSMAVKMLRNSQKSEETRNRNKVKKAMQLIKVVWFSYTYMLLLLNMQCIVKKGTDSEQSTRETP